MECIGQAELRNSRDGAPAPGSWVAAKPTALVSSDGNQAATPTAPWLEGGQGIGRKRRAAVAMASAPGTLAPALGCSGAASLESSVAAAEAAQESLTSWPQKSQQQQRTRQHPSHTPTPSIPAPQGIADTQMTPEAMGAHTIPVILAVTPCNYSDNGCSKAPVTPEAQAAMKRASRTPLAEVREVGNAGSQI